MQSSPTAPATDIARPRASAARPARGGPDASADAAQRSAAHDLAPTPASGAPVAVPANGRFEGLLAFRGEAAVLGELAGRVSARGRLRIGPAARVEACIEVEELLVEGFLRGDVIAARRVELAPSAHVEGEITAPRIALREGCRLRGRLRMEAAGETLELRERSADSDASAS